MNRCSYKTRKEKPSVESRKFKHKDKTTKQLSDILAKGGSLAAACAEASGTLLVVGIPKLKMVGRGCGSPTPVVGTSGKAPCGCFITQLSGKRDEHLCYYCEQIVKTYE